MLISKFICEIYITDNRLSFSIVFKSKSRKRRNVWVMVFINVIKCYDTYLVTRHILIAFRENLIDISVLGSRVSTSKKNWVSEDMSFYCAVYIIVTLQRYLLNHQIVCIFSFSWYWYVSALYRHIKYTYTLWGLLLNLP